MVMIGSLLKSQLQQNIFFTPKVVMDVTGGTKMLLDFIIIQPYMWMMVVCQRLYRAQRR